MYISNDRDSSKFSNIYSMGKNPGHIEYDKIYNGLKALSEILSIYTYIIIQIICSVKVYIPMLDHVADLNKRY